MKKNIIFTSIFTIIFIFSLQGCILDAIDNLTQNVPVNIGFSLHGTAPASDETSFCLSDSKTIQDYRDKIKDVKLVTAVYRTKSVAPVTVQGDVTIKLMKSDGTVLYTTMMRIKPADYISTPYILTFTSAELDIINAYLATLVEGTCFKAQVTAANVNTSEVIDLVGEVDIAFEMTAKL